MSSELIQFIKSCVRKRKIVWTHHVNMRLEGRFISREILLSSVASYEIIEEYPQDKYLPSCLVYAKSGDEVFHIHFAVDREGENVRMVTAYRPTSDKWENDFKTRRKEP